MLHETHPAQAGGGITFGDAPPTLTGTIAAAVMALDWATPERIVEDDDLAGQEFDADERCRRHGQIQEIVDAALVTRGQTPACGVEAPSEDALHYALAYIELKLRTADVLADQIALKSMRYAVAGLLAAPKPTFAPLKPDPATEAFMRGDYLRDYDQEAAAQQPVPASREAGETDLHKIIEHVKGYGVKSDDPRRIYTQCQLELAIRLSAKSPAPSALASRETRDRETMARIIDPDAWASHDRMVETEKPFHGPWTKRSLAKADAILALPILAATPKPEPETGGGLRDRIAHVLYTHNAYIEALWLPDPTAPYEGAIRWAEENALAIADGIIKRCFATPTARPLTEAERGVPTAAVGYVNLYREDDGSFVTGTSDLYDTPAEAAEGNAGQFTDYVGVYALVPASTPALAGGETDQGAPRL